jgi:hypothetical protein
VGTGFFEPSEEDDVENKALADVRRLREALAEAHWSLRALSRAGSRDSELKDLIDVRGYAASRARVAGEALGGLEREAMRKAQEASLAAHGGWRVVADEDGRFLDLVVGHPKPPEIGQNIGIGLSQRAIVKSIEGRTVRVSVVKS